VTQCGSSWRSHETRLTDARQPDFVSFFVLGGSTVAKKKAAKKAAPKKAMKKATKKAAKKK
jgi:hypothetical protein